MLDYPKLATYSLGVMLSMSAAAEVTIERLTTPVGAPTGVDDARFSGNGRFVVLGTDGRLLGTDLDDERDVYLIDRDNNSTIHVSDNIPLDHGPSHGNGQVDVSDNGEVVVFTWASTIFVKDISAGSLVDLSELPSLEEHNAVGAHGPKISSDGRFIVFGANVIDPANGIFRNLFVYDRTLDTTEFVNVSENGLVQSDGLGNYDLSADGRRVAFSSSSSLLVDGDENDANDVFLRDLNKQTTNRVSFDFEGTGTSGVSISGDGKKVGFSFNAGGRWSDPGIQSYIFDVDSNNVSIASRSTCGANVGGRPPLLNHDGRFVAFRKPGPAIFALGVYVRDQHRGELFRAAIEEGIGSGVNSIVIDISDDGSEILMFSNSSKWDPLDINENPDLFVIRREIVAETSDNFKTKIVPHNEWTLLSLPCDASLNTRYTLDELFGNDLGEGVYGVDWAIYTYSRFGPNNLHYTAVSLDSYLPIDQGFWMIQTTGEDVVLDLPDDLRDRRDSSINTWANCSSLAGCARISLFPPRGWNMSGNPTPTVVKFNDLRVRTDAGVCSSESGCSVPVAFDQNIIDNRFYSYSGGPSYKILDGSAQIAPWIGFWVSTSSGSDSSVPTLEFPATP